MVRFGLIVGLVLAIADQLSKFLLIDLVVSAGRPIELTSFFNLVMVWNRGVSFGLFANDSDVGRWVLIGLQVAVVIALVVWLWRVRERFPAAAIGLVLGGAIGNIIDRVHPGRRAVADFFDFHVAGYHWPAFNIADCAIVIGVALLLFDSLFGGRKQVNN